MELKSGWDGYSSGNPIMSKDKPSPMHGCNPVHRLWVAEAVPGGPQGCAGGWLACWLRGSCTLLAVAKPFAAQSASSWHPGLLNWSQLAVLPPTTLVIIHWQHSESGCEAAEHYIPAGKREN